MDPLQETKLEYARGVRQHGERLPDGFDVLKLYRSISFRGRQAAIENSSEHPKLRILLGAIATIDTIHPDVHFGRALTHALGHAARSIPSEIYPESSLATPIIPLERIRQAEEGDYGLKGFTLNLLQTAFGSVEDQ